MNSSEPLGTKHSKLWPDLLACRAAFVEPPQPGDEPHTIHKDDRVSLV
jgi:hypothetical protein